MRGQQAAFREVLKGPSFVLRARLLMGPTRHVLLALALAATALFVADCTERRTSPAAPALDAGLVEAADAGADEGVGTSPDGGPAPKKARMLSVAITSTAEDGGRLLLSPADAGPNTLELKVRRNEPR